MDYALWGENDFVLADEIYEYDIYLITTGQKVRFPGSRKPTGN